jgi:NMD protein affecting ribosome stability and mRNA decay
MKLLWNNMSSIPCIQCGEPAPDDDNDLCDECTLEEMTDEELKKFEIKK